MSVEATTLVVEEADQSLLTSAATIEKRPYFPAVHPILPPRSQAEAEEVYERMAVHGTPGEQEQYARWWKKRQVRIQQAEDPPAGEPYEYGFELPHWKDADAELRRCEIGLYDAGGKRASKSEWAGKRFVQAACTFPRMKMWALQANETTSIATQQALVWKYLPQHIRALNGKARHGFAKVNYSIDGGFTEGVLVLPNLTEIYFLTFKSDPKQYQGWELGANLNDQWRALMEEKPWLHNIGAWLDEDAPLTWVETAEMRCSTRAAKVLWTFSTMDGITLAVKEVLGAPKTIKSRRAVLFPEKQKLVPDCPPGHMPYIQACTRKGWRAMYFHTDLNLFGNNWPEVRKRCEGKAFAYVAENAYGWSEDARQKAWPLFGGWNIVEESELPEGGTNYMLTDPAGARNWATIWCRVAPGNPSRIFIYRDWPDERRYGPWAEPDPGSQGNNGNPDGRAGRAQRSLGYGYDRYKQLWLSEERIKVPIEVMRLRDGIIAPIEGRVADVSDRSDFVELRELLDRLVGDPYHRRLILQAYARGDDLERVQEKIHARFIDPRAGRDEKTAREGGTCAIDELAKEGLDKRTGEIIPRMRFLPAKGFHIETGIQAVVALLYWDKQQPLDALLNAPRLYVSRRCAQVIWCMTNYTNQGGEAGACKDFADLLRYMGLEELRYVAGGVRTTGGGSY